MFRRARDPRNVRETERPGWVREATGGRRGLGVRFEKRVQRALRERFGESRVACNTWFEFEDGDEVRHCSPDAIVFLEDGPVVIEVKTVHCKKAWYQINQLYVPVLEVMYPGLRFRGVEICSEFRPDVPWPELTLIGDVERAPRRGTGVHVTK